MPRKVKTASNTNNEVGFKMKKKALIMLVLFLPAILQEGNPLPILKGIVRLQLSDERLMFIDSDRYITRTEGSDDVIISFLENNGWMFEEQFGSAYIFNKQDNLINVGSKQYSRYFRLWQIPNLE